MPDYRLFGRRGVRQDAVSRSRARRGNIRVRVRVSFTTGSVRSAILATAGLLVSYSGLILRPNRAKMSDKILEELVFLSNLVSTSASLCMASAS